MESHEQKITGSELKQGTLRQARGGNQTKASYKQKSTETRSHRTHQQQNTSSKDNESTTHSQNASYGQADSQKNSCAHSETRPKNKHRQMAATTTDIELWDKQNATLRNAMAEQFKTTNELAKTSKKTRSLKSNTRQRTKEYGHQVESNKNQGITQIKRK